MHISIYRTLNTHTTYRRYTNYTHCPYYTHATQNTHAIYKCYTLHTHATQNTHIGHAHKHILEICVYCLVPACCVCTQFLLSTTSVSLKMSIFIFILSYSKCLFFIFENNSFSLLKYSTIFFSFYLLYLTTPSKIL